jgi:hypothetical protein
MDFVNYNPTEEQARDGESSPDEMDIEYIAHEYGNIEKIIDLDTTSFTREVEMEDAVDALTTGLKAVAIADQKKVKKYGPDQIRRFMELVQEEGMSIPKAAVQAMIPRSSAISCSTSTMLELVQ